MNSFITIMPEELQRKLNELIGLVREYPERIPPKVAATFLKIDIVAFREMMKRREVPFALCHEGHEICGQSTYYIPTLAFWQWVMQKC